MRYRLDVVIDDLSIKVCLRRIRAPFRLGYVASVTLSSTDLDRDMREEQRRCIEY